VRCDLALEPGGDQVARALARDVQARNVEQLPAQARAPGGRPEIRGGCRDPVEFASELRALASRRAGRGRVALRGPGEKEPLELAAAHTSPAAATAIEASAPGAFLRSC